LSALVKTGFLRIQNGSYVQVEPVADTGNALDEVLGLRFHSSTLEVWAKILGLADKNSREVGLLNLPVSSKKIPELKERIRKFQDEIIGWLQDESQPDQIVQLGVYLVPTTTSSAQDTPVGSSSG
jgi:uncharacterized protein (TIGR02147 family)